MNYILSFILCAISFGSPMHIPVQLAGNFGEPRPNHFHGGIDVKTERGVNFGIYSIADGYIERAIVDKYGFGRAIVVAHPNGYTSVYVHLNRFAPQIQAAVNQQQYKTKRFAGDFHFRAGELPVCKGQFIALSGNTGSSQGPHLHLEMHEKTTDNLMDPLNWLGGIVHDTTAPTAYSFKSYPQRGEGVFQRSADSKIYDFIKGKYQAWGKVGFGVWAYDHMDSVYNNYGVRYTELYCDGKLVFKSDVNGIPQKHNRMINSWGDYNHYMSRKIWYLKSFIEPGNRLPILKASASRGIINFNQKRNYHLRYVFRDYYGNETTKDIVVEGVPQPIPPAEKIEGANALLTSKDNNITLDGVRFNIPHTLLATNYLMNPKHFALGTAYSAGYSFASGSVPLLDYAKISIRVNTLTSDPSKFYMVCKQSIGEPEEAARYCGGTYNDGWVTGRFRDLGNIYYVRYDDKAPTVHPIGRNVPHLMYKISERGSGINAYEAYLDGRFVLFEQGKDKQVIFCDLRKTGIKPTKKQRTLKLFVRDNRQNQCVHVEKFVY